jgi:hypothetical protein
MTWLRPGTTWELITLTSYVYIKCFSTFWCSGWSSLLHKTMEVWAELPAQSESQTCKFHTTMTWLRPGTTLEWITLPLYIYINCLSTFQCSRWSPLLYKSHGGGLRSWIGVTIRYNPYYYDMVETKNHFRLDYTSTLHIHIVFSHLPMQWMVIWMQPYFIKAMEVDWAGWIWLTTGYKTYHYNYDIAFAKNHFRLDYTSILYIYKVFKHPTMQWMVIWMHPYFVTPMEVGWTRLNLSNKWVKSILLQEWHGWGQEPLKSGLHFHIMYI